MEDFSANNSGGDTLWGEAGARVSLRYPVFSSVSPWYYAASLEVEADYRGCLSLAYTVSTNALDTPGSPLRKYYLLDSRKGTLLSAAEVFSDTLALREMLTDTFLEKLGLTPGMPLQEQGILLPADGRLPLTDDFRISSQGATFRYDMSTLAPTILPESEVFLPAEVIEPLYKK